MAPVNVSEYEKEAKSLLPKEIFDYFSSGANDELTLSRNIAGFKKIFLLPRVLRDTSTVNTGVQIFEYTLTMPVLIAPMAFQSAAHESGELGTIRASNRAGVGMIASSMSTVSLEAIAEISTNLCWFQLYVYKDRAITERLVRRAEAAGYTAIVLTVDAPIMGRRERDIRNGFKLPSNLKAMNFIQEGADEIRSDALGSQLKNYTDDLFDKSFTWDDLSWLRSISKLPIVIKGIMHEADAAIAREHGVDAIVISNHGGRQLDGTPATIEVLPNIARELEGKMSLFIDGGFRRGSDIFKAIALGADAVLIGRPILWALAHSGELGVEELLNIFQVELQETMTLCGCRDISEIKSIGREMIRLMP